MTCPERLTVLECRSLVEQAAWGVLMETLQWQHLVAVAGQAKQLLIVL